MKEIIKRILVGAVIALLIAAAFSMLETTKAKADGKTRRECVMLRGQDVGANTGDGYHYEGLMVLNSSSSAGAPLFTNAVIGNGGYTQEGMPLAEAVATLLTAGYRIEYTDSTGRNFVLVR
jgi:hypothetical protein